MDEDEYEGRERFGMENDYEGGEWIGGEFFYRRKKERAIQTKDDAIYGSFAVASSDSDSEGGRSSQKRRKGDLISKPDLSKPVNFVSGSVMTNQDPDRERDDRETAGRSQGLGFGLGFQEEKKEAEGSDAAGEDEDSFLPTSFGRKIKEGAQRREREREKEKEKGRSKLAKKPFGGSDVAGNSGLTGLRPQIMNMMKSMGYKEGHGLGKNKQGIVTAIEAMQRPKSAGLGFNNYQEQKMPVLAEVQQEKTAVPSAAAGRSREKRWTKQKQGKNKLEILTADELLAKKQEQGIDVVRKVLDMRGPQVKVLSTLENLNAEEEMKENEVPMPELQYNVRLIVQTTEIDIQKVDRELRLEREKVVSLQREKEKIVKEEARQRQQLQVMERIATVLEKVKEDNSSGTLTLDSLLMTFRDLKERFAEDYKLCNISSIACAFAYPLLIRVFQGWEPLQNPMHGLNLMSAWKDLLQGDQPYDFSENNFVASPYARLVNEVIFPAVRISGTNTWQARDPEPMLRFLESWEKLLPPLVLQSILENIVMPKLTSAVQSWDPRRETISIHVWVHPWLPLLGQRLEVLYHTIRHKLGTVLHAWHASDASAYAILSPWRDVFDAASWEDLMIRHIIPKLRLALQEFQVNPANQKLDQFNWVMMWASMIPIHHMVHILEVDFFSKWQHVLYHWLCSNPNFPEVTQWYMGWKGFFPAELLANERIRMLFTAGLDMMNKAAEGIEVVQPGIRENISYLRASEKRQFEFQQAAPYSSGHANDVGNISQMSLKEAIEEYAMEQGLLFLPKVGKSYNGLPVYGFGSVNICIDSVKQTLYAQVLEERDRWNEVSLTGLMEMHRNAVRR